MPRRNRVIFCGPPGCGKTSAAEALAAELGVPLVVVRLDAIVSSYLGQTAGNLRRIFDYASTARWVVLFDEFDALGRERSDPSEHGEIKRVVNSFLQLLDSYTGPGLLVAATNHEETLDPRPVAPLRRGGGVLAADGQRRSARCCGVASSTSRRSRCPSTRPARACAACPTQPPRQRCGRRYGSRCETAEPQ